MNISFPTTPSDLFLLEGEMNFPSFSQPWAEEGSLAHRVILVKVWWRWYRSTQSETTWMCLVARVWHEPRWLWRQHLERGVSLGGPWAALGKLLWVEGLWFRYLPIPLLSSWCSLSSFSILPPSSNLAFLTPYPAPHSFTLVICYRERSTLKGIRKHGFYYYPQISPLSPCWLWTMYFIALNLSSVICRIGKNQTVFQGLTQVLNEKICMQKHLGHFCCLFWG